MKSTGVSQRAFQILGGLSALSLIAGVVLSLFQEEVGVVRSAGPDAFSYSALGHRGFRELLELHGHRVIISRSASGPKMGKTGVLVLAEPNLTTAPTSRRIRMRDMVRESPAVLLVLPKRQGFPLFSNLRHVGQVSPRSEDAILAPLKALGLEADLLRDTGHSRDQHWTAGAWPDRPFIDRLQLLDMPGLEPLLASEKGVLLGRLSPTAWESSLQEGPHDILILSDPDLLANHGLGKGGNGALMLKIIDGLRGADGAVVIDETLHGHEISPSIFRSFFRFPLVFILMHMLAVALVLLWMATGRFGSPIRPQRRTGRGLDFLLDNTAELLAVGGHGPYILERYFRSATATVCHRLHLGAPADGSRDRQRLITITQSRCPEFDFTRMSRDVPAAAGEPSVKNSQVLTMARAIWNWQREMTHGL
ncbi:hypothetical protein CSB20_04595 [bacterium DOLZORAL124_64_63]|nr:MAG: hypothetical protein CSB20_04595 [bacterium DOLZORAL124_64_63]